MALRKIVALAGGVGGAKLAHGLTKILAPDELTVIVNIGDDFEHYGLHISPDLDTVTRVDGATFVALNSTAPWRAVVGGRIDDWQIDWAREAFARCERGEVRALVIHHHFVSTPDGTGGRPLPGAAELVRAFESMEVDFVLGGHVHSTHVRSSRDLVGGPDEGVPLVACGTTTSRRGRGPEEGANSLNVLHVSPRGLEIQPHLLAAGAREFVPVDPMVLALGRATELARGGRER